MVLVMSRNDATAPDPDEARAIDDGKRQESPLSWLDRIPAFAVPALLIGVPALVAIAAWLAPSMVYDHFVWPYYWGPIKADALGLGPSQTLEYHGVATHSGYNAVNTSTWALLLGLCILGLAQLLRRLKSTMDSKLIVAATTWVVAGSLFHVMEDTGLFRPPLQYVFITPPIYLLFAAFGAAAFVFAHRLRTMAAKRGAAAASLGLAAALAVLCAIALAVWLSRWNLVVHILNPLAFVAVAAATWLAAHWRLKRAVEPAEIVTILGCGAILLGLAYVVAYATSPWPDLNGGLPAASHPVAFLAIPLALVPVGLLAGWATWRQRGQAQDVAARAFLQPINLLLVFSQMLDAFATALAIDGFGYDEKHVVSRGVIDAARSLYSALGWAFGAEHPTFLGFVPIKLAIGLLVVYAIDVSGKDTRGHTTLIGLVKFAIIMVGLGPGLRDLTRLALGV